MSNLNKANSLTHEWVESMGGLEAIQHDHDSDLSGLMQALDDAGLLMPDLPVPDSMKLNGDVKYFVCDGVQVRQDTEGDHVQMYSKSLITTTEARRLALALLAASEQAEKRTEQ